MGTFLRACPQVVRDRYIAVLMTDGGLAHFSEDQLQQGWQLIDDIGYGPKIETVEQYPYYQIDGPDGPGYDEWYILTEPRILGQRVSGNIFQEAAPAPGRVTCFGSYAGFAPCEAGRELREILDLFWPQLDRINPESYLADTDACVFFVSQNRALFESVFETLRTLDRPDKTER